MNKKIIGIFVCNLLIATAILPAVGIIETEGFLNNVSRGRGDNSNENLLSEPCNCGDKGKCPPYGATAGTVQPPYDITHFGLSGWRCHTQIKEDVDGKPHIVEIACLDRTQTTNDAGQTVSDGDEFLVLIVDGKPVGKCSSEYGENSINKGSVFGTTYRHCESNDPDDKDEHDPDIWDDWEYFYNYLTGKITVFHTSDGWKDDKPVYDDQPPPEHPDDLPPKVTNTNKQTGNYYVNEVDFNPPFAEIVTPKKGFLYIFGEEIFDLSIIGLSETALIIGPINIEVLAYDGEPGTIHNETGMHEVDFYLDEHLIETDKWVDFSCTLSEPLIWEHKLTIVARDYAQNEVVDEVSFWIFNI